MQFNTAENISVPPLALILSAKAIKASSEVPKLLVSTIPSLNVIAEILSFGFLSVIKVTTASLKSLMLFRILPETSQHSIILELG